MAVDTLTIQKEEVRVASLLKFFVASSTQRVMEENFRI